MATSKKTTAHSKKATHHVSHKENDFIEKVIGYDGKDDGLRPLRMSVILITLLSILVVSIITYFVGIR
jgi:hypothetical protein